MIRVIRDMYSKVKSCVRIHNATSDSFYFCVGLKQGVTILPLFFALFIEDLELYLIGNNSCGLKNITILLVLFKDDMLVFSENVSDLQNNNIYQYCRKWGLEVITDK